MIQIKTLLGCSKDTFYMSTDPTLVEEAFQEYLHRGDLSPGMVARMGKHITRITHIDKKKKFVDLQSLFNL